jgi:protein phosphatase
MKTFSMTDKGRTRDMNQDCVFTSEKPVGNLPNLFVVADGMGGHRAGDYASRYAVEVLTREVEASRETDKSLVLRQAITRANQELLLAAQADVKLHGMGTTMVVATIEGQHLWVANVGDSRLYLIDETIHQVTRDHSLVEEMVRQGRISREEARVHKDKNVITRAVGAVDEIQVDICELELDLDSQILMCTDGLSNMIPDDEILTIIRTQRDIAEKVERLVQTANDNGGTDNITVVVIEPF